MSADLRPALRRELARAELFDEGVEAARNACVAGASIASAAITAAAYYDNPLTGVGALRACMRRLASAPPALDALRDALARGPRRDDPDAAFAPGFGFVTDAQAPLLFAAARRLLAAPSASHPAALRDGRGDDRREVGGDERREGPAPIARFLLSVYEQLAPTTGPLNHAGLAALVFLEGEVSIDEAERWYLLARVETAVAEAQKTRHAGLAAFPFLSESYVYEGPRPPVRTFDLADLRRRVGLD